MLHHQVYKDGPEVCAFGVAAQDFLEHGLGSFFVPVLELKPSKSDYQVYICNGKNRGQLFPWQHETEHLESI